MIVPAQPTVYLVDGHTLAYRTHFTLTSSGFSGTTPSSKPMFFTSANSVTGTGWLLLTPPRHRQNTCRFATYKLRAIQATLH